MTICNIIFNTFKDTRKAEYVLVNKRMEPPRLVDVVCNSDVSGRSNDKDYGL
jgi:hypothetical protein